MEKETYGFGQLYFRKPPTGRCNLPRESVDYVWWFNGVVFSTWIFRRNLQLKFTTYSHHFPRSYIHWIDFPSGCFIGKPGPGLSSRAHSTRDFSAIHGFEAIGPAKWRNVKEKYMASSTQNTQIIPNIDPNASKNINLNGIPQLSSIISNYDHSLNDMNWSVFSSRLKPKLQHHAACWFHPST